MVRIRVLVCALAGMGMSWAALPQPARACGGLFCNQSQPVNQAAERILFTANGDDTVTAVIEIQYEGPSKSFSWLLPVPGVPKVGLSSKLAFDRLQQNSNPRYMLTTTFEGQCGGGLSKNAKGLAPSASLGSATHSDTGGVTVVASGSLGPYDYEVIKVDAGTKNPEDAALKWLMDNGYDVTALGPEVLRPYLADSLNLIAFRLKKDAMTGSIRPIMITYAATQPYIPIRPTAVAANDNMGVMVWVGGKSRAIPDNYKALELNEALIDWFSPMSTYDKVVSAAADEAKGQGFVTEMAGSSDTFKNQILLQYDMQNWDKVSNGQFSGAADFVGTAQQTLGNWDGFTDALQDALTLPKDATVSDYLNCMKCYDTDPAFKFDADVFRKSLYEKVYKPMLDTEMLVQSRPYVTRLYTTMSADEMTLDPTFNFNADLGDVSNVHTAEQVVNCDDSWRVTLPQGGTVYGTEPGTWPNHLGDQPAALKIMQLATQGKGIVMVDNSDKITKALLESASHHKGAVSLAPEDAKSTGKLTGSGDCSAAPASPARTQLFGWLAVAACGLLALRRRR
jgi:MYXO-CTERM domain-containing protein